jgi:hypothetical protein
MTSRIRYKQTVIERGYYLGLVVFDLGFANVPAASFLALLALTTNGPSVQPLPRQRVNGRLFTVRALMRSDPNKRYDRFSDSRNIIRA